MYQVKLATFAVSLGSCLVASSALAAEMGAAGLVLNGSSQIVSSLQIPHTEYVGGCPGEETVPVEAWFLSKATSPAPDQRVMVTNISPALAGEVLPYTDRSYDSGDRSAHTYLLPGTRHHRRTLTVIEGLNQFRYEISRSGSVIEAGQFDLDVELATRYVRRDPVWEWVYTCEPATTPVPNCYYRSVLRCPLGNEF